MILKTEIEMFAKHTDVYTVSRKAVIHTKQLKIKNRTFAPDHWFPNWLDRAQYQPFKIRLLCTRVPCITGLNWPLKPLVLSDQLNLLTNPTLSVVSGVQGQDPTIVESPIHLTNRNRKLNQKPVNQKAVFIPSGRGNAFLQDEQGYYYMKNRTSDKDNTIYWRCRVKRKFKCPVKVTTKGFNITLISHEHTHKIIPLNWKTRLELEMSGLC